MHCFVDEDTIDVVRGRIAKQWKFLAVVQSSGHMPAMNTESK